MAGRIPLSLRWKLWLKKLPIRLFPSPFMLRLGNPEAYPANEQGVIKAIMGRWEREAAALRRLGIPLPHEVSALTFEPRPHLRLRGQLISLNVTYPRFEPLPPHFVFCARLPPAPDTPPQKAPQTAVFFFAASEVAVNEAAGTLKERGLLEVMRRFPGKWYNRDPYAGYRLKSSGAILSCPMAEVAAENTRRNWDKDVPPLEVLPGYSVSALEQMQRRLDFYAAFDSAASPPPLTRLLQYSTEGWRRPHLPDHILFDLPLPQPIFSPEPVSLKILPSGDAPTGLMQSLLTSLRPVQHPLGFELIDDGASAYFQLCCGADDVDLIARQLRLHFPSFSIEEHEGADTGTLEGVSIQQAALYQPLRTLSEFTLDPLGQLFAILDEAVPNELTALQVLFFPLPDAALRAVLEHLQGQTKRRPDEEAVGRIRQGLQKLPAWQVSVRLLCSNPTTLFKLKTEFLAQYQSTGQMGTFLREQATINQRDMSNWMLLSTPELAAFAHFPTSEGLV